MADTPKPTDAPKVQCDVCLKEIPKSSAKNAQVEDYFLYFCGLECYSEWTAKKNGLAGEKPGKKPD